MFRTIVAGSVGIMPLLSCIVGGDAVSLEPDMVSSFLPCDNGSIGLLRIRRNCG